MKIKFNQRSIADQAALVVNVVGFCFVGYWQNWLIASMLLILGLVITFRE